MKFLLSRSTLTTLGFGLAPFVIISSTAGKWDLWNVWALCGLSVFIGTFQALWLYRKNPGLLKEQMKPSGRELRSRRLPHIGFNVMLLLALIIAGLDQRLHWSDMLPKAGIVAGLVMTAAGLGLYTWAMLTNRFFSSLARIQADRGQHVIQNGPYAYLRHPGYAGVVMFVIGTLLALNSLLALIPAALAVGCLARMTAVEDWMLRDKLVGYSEYASRVHYRLIPGFW